MLTMRYRELTILATLGVLTTMPAHAAPAADALNLTATSVNVVESGSPIKIQVIRWSTDEERMPVVAALNPAAPAPAATATGANPTAAAGGRGRGGRGGRGARGGRSDAPLDPVAALTAAIGRAPTLGYIWTKDVTGYSIKYAYHAALPDGSERIILATDRRLGAYSQAWKPLGAEASANYDFTLVEIRLGAAGASEGKSSLTAKVITDTAAATIALENYAAAPATLQKVEKFKGQSSK